MHEELKKIVSQAMNTRFEFEQKLIQQAWENETFKQELLSNPRAVYARESKEELPKELEIEVIQESANKIYLVLPNNPAPATTSGELSEADLETVAGGSCRYSSREYEESCSWFSASKKRSAEGLV
ncbi:MAG: NHLP leader peptide family natural product precursor [Fischerella sp.]|jgi:hypothetical protein|uniref:NHLP leader peptide family RiPP precursor n=1 Tax=unclassified Fischerella TaxID=494603 RepID=UPI000478F2A2|nr:MULTISPECIES: NHLP leader peptide family RiPP precursor [unclassified Fischerella]NWF60348.1 NHLP leader peptide family natural product precursor [Fischerella sp.]